MENAAGGVGCVLLTLAVRNGLKFPHKGLIGCKTALVGTQQNESVGIVKGN